MVETGKATLYRFIPACAGNTCPGYRGESVRPVHPRVRGEYYINTGDLYNPTGSSPRARGILCATRQE